MSVHRNILGVILAGGSARRLFPGNAGGGDKGLADLSGLPMLAHVIARFRPQVDALILNANGDPKRFAEFGLVIVPDLDDRRQGPLAGLLAAMDWAERTDKGCAAIATVTTDVPFLPSDLVARLAAASGERPAIALSAGRSHPAIALWPVALKGEVRAALDRPELGMNAFAKRQDAIAVSFPFSETGGVPVDPFFNANTPDDLEMARRLLTRDP